MKQTHTRIRLLPRFALLTAFALQSAIGQNSDENEADIARRAANHAAATEHLAQWVECQESGDTVRDWTGVAANRKTRTVRFYAEATGIKGDTPVEFFLIGERSGNDYEALAIALASPADIHAALRFIGMPQGNPVDQSAYRFWPRGERAAITINGIRVESLIMDETRNAPIPQSGLIFTGSQLIPSESDPTHLVPSAETAEPFAIAANYNESASLFDVPRQAGQGAVYGKQSANPDYFFEEGKLLCVEIKPLTIDGASYTRDLALLAASGDTGDTSITITENGEPIETDDTLQGALATFVALRERGFDCHVAIHFSDSLPLTEARKLATILQAVDVEEGIHIGPPPTGQLYYKAFIPPDSYASREKRFQQPWELRLARDSGEKGAISGIATHLDQTWDEEAQTFHISATDHPVANPNELGILIDKIGPGIGVIIVYCKQTDNMRVGDIMAFLAPILDTNGMVFIYIDEQPEPLPTKEDA